jgi:hypothetical protein
MAGTGHALGRRNGRCYCRDVLTLILPFATRVRPTEFEPEFSWYSDDGLPLFVGAENLWSSS